MQAGDAIRGRSRSSLRMTGFASFGKNYNYGEPWSLRAVINIRFSSNKANH